MNDLSGMNLGRYNLIEKLGEGGMAVVYKAFDSRLECSVAVKVIRTDMLAPAYLQEALKRFEREAKSVAQLTHPNIVEVRDYGEMDGIPYLVMPFLPSGTLKDLIRHRRKIAWGETIQIILPIAQAIEYAHSHRIIHRDIKPSNILMTENGQPMLTDFGIAKIVDVSDGHDSLTATGTTIGTPEYMAPEQWEGNTVDVRADIYALGIVFYEMVTGRPPFKADTVPGTMAQVLRDPLPRPTIFTPDLPLQVEQFLYKVVAKNPSDRYQSMTDVIAVLQQMMNLSSASPVIPIQGGYPPPYSPAGYDSRTSFDDKATNYQGVPPPPPSGWPGYLPEPPARGKSKWWVALLVGGVLLVIAAVLLVIIKPWQDGSMPGVAKNPTENPEVITGEETKAGNLSITETATMFPTKSLGVGSVDESQKDNMAMVYVPAGTFTMGSGDANYNGIVDDPPHQIYLDTYWIDQTEVTVGMYQECVKDRECNLPKKNNSYYRENYYNDPAYSNFPVIFVSWDDANAYCAWAGERLPTEAEWEKAAGGPDGRTYPWGDQYVTGNLANFSDANSVFEGADPSVDDGYKDTAPVGSYPKGQSYYGALDMAGNVWEWVADKYGQDYYSISPSSNPIGPEKGAYRVLRGSSAGDPANTLRVTYRFFRSADLQTDFIGFRCVMPATE